MGTERRGLKSAVDLALERLAQRGGEPVRLSEAQKLALAEVDRQTKAKLAEREILKASQGEDAAGDPAKADELKAAQRAEIESIKRRAESEKDRIRKGSAS